MKFFHLFLNLLILPAFTASCDSKLGKFTACRMKRYFLHLLYTDSLLLSSSYLLVLILEDLITTVLHSACPLLSFLWPLSLQTEETLPCEAAALSHWAFHSSFSAFSLTLLCPPYDVKIRSAHSALHVGAWSSCVVAKWWPLSSSHYHFWWCPVFTAVAHWLSPLKEVCQQGLCLSFLSCWLRNELYYISFCP